MKRNKYPQLNSMRTHLVTHIKLGFIFLVTAVCIIFLKLPFLIPEFANAPSLINEKLVDVISKPMVFLLKISPFIYVFILFNDCWWQVKTFQPFKSIGTAIKRVKGTKLYSWYKNSKYRYAVDHQLAAFISLFALTTFVVGTAVIKSDSLTETIDIVFAERNFYNYIIIQGVFCVMGVIASLYTSHVRRTALLKERIASGKETITHIDFRVPENAVCTLIKQTPNGFLRQKVQFKDGLVEYLQYRSAVNNEDLPAWVVQAVQQSMVEERK